MPTHMEFDEEWLRDYERRTGLKARDMSGKPAMPEDKPKRRKYGNRPTEYGGRIFDSAHEAKVYGELELRVKAGELLGVICQQPFALPGGVKYVADFITLKRDGTFDVIDAKSEATRKNKVYRLKRRLMRECLGIEITEV